MGAQIESMNLEQIIGANQWHRQDGESGALAPGTAPVSLCELLIS